MASCQTWTPSSHIRHPWFDAPIAKRKHRDTLEPGEADADASSSSSPSHHSHSPSLSPPTFASPSPIPFGLRTARPPPTKRRRCSPIENGLAQLSLAPTATSPVTPQAPMPVFLADAGDAYPQVQELPTTSTPSMYMPTPAPAPLPAYMPMSAQSTPSTMDLDVDMPPFTVPPTAYTVEEPASFPVQPAPALPEVSMRPPPAWYEPAPDRIVITDLDAFSREDEEEEEEEERRRRGSPESSSASASTDEEGVGGVKVNEALLARIRAGRKVGGVAPPKNQNTSQALVLFRPLPLTTFEKEKAEEKAAAPSQQVAGGSADDDAMDVEP